MTSRDHRDVIAGAILVVVGCFTIAYAFAYLKLGSFSRMGPGMFPTLVGVSTLLLGAGIALPALRRPAQARINIDFRAGLFVLGAILVFALTLPAFGLIPAIIALTFVAGFADNKLSLRNATFLSAGLIVLALAIFVFGFRIQIDIISWPW